MQKSKLKLKLIQESYAVCRLDVKEELPSWCNWDSFISITKTDDELSIVCEEKDIPNDILCEKGWRILKILGPLDFSLIGILSEISSLLAVNKISIFAISTYDTDYILVKNNLIKKAITVLSEGNFEIVE